MTDFTNAHRLGMIPMFFSEHDPRPAKEQMDANYAHGGGFIPFTGFDLHQRPDGQYYLKYPEDPPMNEIGRGRVRDELIVVFDCAWVAIIQPDGSYEVARCD